MNELLQAVRDSLQTLGGIRARDVFVTPHPNYIPTGVKQPCIGIKDGKITRKELTAGMIEETLQVVCFPMTKVSGDGLTDEGGLLSLEKAIEEKLDQNLLDLPGMEYAWSPGSGESKMFYTDNKQWLNQKAITMEYTRERER